MSQAIAGVAILVAQFLLLAAMGIAIFRVLRGPRAQDRVLAFDAAYVDAMLLILTLGIRTGSLHYIEIAMLIAVLGFIASTAYAKFLMRGEVIE